MGLTSTSRVVTRAEYYGKRKLLQPGNREWVTAIECISHNDALPPVIIFKGKVFIQGWFSTAPPEWRFHMSSNGWTTDQISLDWLQNHFIPHIQKRQGGAWKLLVMDGHGSHLTAQFDAICKENKIIPLCMPSHSSHLLQPLDIGCFSAIKKAYGQYIQSKLRSSIHSIDKHDFLHAYIQARLTAYKTDTISNSWVAAGIIPYNPEQVLKNITIQLRTPTPPSSRGSEGYVPHTPQRPIDIHRQTSSINTLLRQRSKTPPEALLDQIQQMSKGFEKMAHRTAFLIHENQRLQAEVDHQHKKRARSRKQIPYNQGLNAGQVQQQIFTELNAQEADTAAAADALASNESANQRPPQRCGICKNIGHRRNRCPEAQDT